MHLFLLLVLLLVVVVVVGFALVAVSKLQKSPSRPLAESNSKLSPNSGLTKNQSLKQRQQKLYKENNSPKSRVASFFAQLEQRNYCIAVLRCHTEQVVCFAFHPKNRCLVSCSSDRSVRIWWDPVDRQAKFSSVNLFTLAASEDGVKFPDSAVACCWKKDGQSILFALNYTRAIRAYDISENQKVVAGSLDVISPQKNTVKDIDVDPRLRYFLTYDDSSTFVVWNMRGTILTSVDTHQVKINQVAISADGRFVASAGFIADVYIWEVLFQKDNGEFLGLNKVMDLKGHHAGVTGVAFSRDNKLATVCKDRTIRVWNIEVRYKLGEDAKLLFSLDPWDTQVDLLHVTFSPKGDLLAVAGNDSVAFYSLDTRQVVTVLRQCTGRTTVDIKKFGFSGDGTLLATLGQGQQWISLWNIPAMPSFSSVHP